MVEVTRQKFSKEVRVKELAVVDLASSDIPFQMKFDFVTAIRVLKYNQNWKEIIVKVGNCLATGGIFVFTLPNKNSLNRFSSYAISSYKSSQGEIKKLVMNTDLELIEISGFTKIPDKIYEMAQSTVANKSIINGERALNKVLGHSLLSRELFVAVRKKH